jgi:hypothetical protein
MNESISGLHGAYLRDDLVAEFGPAAVRGMLRTGQVVRYAEQVLVDRRRSADLLTRAAAALLLVGSRAVLNSHTAALLHGCGAADSGTVHVLSTYERKVPRKQGLALHQQATIAENEVTVLNGMRTLGLEAVLVDMLCTADRRVALAVLDQAMAMLDAGYREPFRTELANRIANRTDRRGTRRAQPLLHLGTGLTESPAESFLLLEIFDAGLPLPGLQVPVIDIGGFERYRLDFAWEGPKVALEYDGYEAHEGRELADARREADLRSRGWLVIRACAADLRKPASLIAALRTAFGKRRYAA